PRPDSEATTGRPAAAPSWIDAFSALPAEARFELDGACRVLPLQPRELVVGQQRGVVARRPRHGEEVRMVERVQQLRRNLQARTTDDRRPLGDADVVLLKYRAVDHERLDATVAEAAGVGRRG